MQTEDSSRMDEENRTGEEEKLYLYCEEKLCLSSNLAVIGQISQSRPLFGARHTEGLHNDSHLPIKKVYAISSPEPEARRYQVASVGK